MPRHDELVSCLRLTTHLSTHTYSLYVLALRCVARLRLCKAMDYGVVAGVELALFWFAVTLH